MDMRKLSFKRISIVLAAAMVLMVFVGVASAENMCQIIKIGQTAAESTQMVNIDPAKVTVPVGTCTIWVNFIRDKIVSVSFRENAKECIASIDSSSGFEGYQLGEGESCYLSERLRHGKTSSIIWNTPGVYKYTIEVLGYHADDGKKLSQGVIEVK